jgi:hypothetical protein
MSLFESGELNEERKKERKLTIEKKRREEKRVFSTRLSPKLIQNIGVVSRLRGVTVEEAVEEALFEWIRVNTPPGVTINIYQPVSVSIAKVDKIEIQILTREMQRLLKVFENPSTPTNFEAINYREKCRDELLEKLRKAVVLEERTRDPELQVIITQAEVALK